VRWSTERLPACLAALTRMSVMALPASRAMRPPIHEPVFSLTESPALLINRVSAVAATTMSRTQSPCPCLPALVRHLIYERSAVDRASYGWITSSCGSSCSSLGPESGFVKTARCASRGPAPAPASLALEAPPGACRPAVQPTIDQLTDSSRIQGGRCRLPRGFSVPLPPRRGCRSLPSRCTRSNAA